MKLFLFIVYSMVVIFVSGTGGREHVAVNNTNLWVGGIFLTLCVLVFTISLGMLMTKTEKTLPLCVFLAFGILILFLVLVLVVCIIIQFFIKI